MTEALIPDSYREFLNDLKGRIRAAQLRASIARVEEPGRLLRDWPIYHAWGPRLAS